VDLATNDLQVTIMTFNPETGIYLNIRLKFDFSRGGWVEQRIDIDVRENLIDIE
jgi:hypothetical protein